MEKQLVILKTALLSITITGLLSLIIIGIFYESIVPQNHPDGLINFSRTFRGTMTDLSNYYIITVLIISIFDMLAGSAWLLLNWKNLERRKMIIKFILLSIGMTILYLVFYAIVNTQFCCGARGDQYG